VTSVQDAFARVEPVHGLSGFRLEFYDCLAARADALFELVDAMLCADGPVKSLVELSLAPEHRRGHGALYDAVNTGRVEFDRLRGAIGALAVPRAGDGRITLAVDVSNWLRPDAAVSPDRLFCHVYGRGRSADQFIPGWPYSFVAALETGRTSWTALLDVQRLTPADDATAVTAAQLREVVERLITAGHWAEGDPEILIVADTGYDLPRIAHVLADLPVVIAGRVRSDRVFCFPAANTYRRQGGRPSKHGSVFKLVDAASWPDPAHTTRTETTRYGSAVASAWDRLHPRLTHRTSWLDDDGELPLIEGTVIRLEVERLPGDVRPKPVWLWASLTGAHRALIDVLWQAYLRRFDLEHTFRMLKQTLGWTRPRLRDPNAADTWTWLVIAAHTQLRLARDHVADLRRPWERPSPPNRLTPARVRRGFRNIRPTLPLPAGAPKPPRPGPGRPPGSRNRRPATVQNVGKTVKRDLTVTAHEKRTAPARTN
jgi:DDE superfamily endonuclease